MLCPLYRGCPLLRGSNRIILIGRDKFGDLVLSIVERYLIQCPFLGGSFLRGSTVVPNFFSYTGGGSVGGSHFTPQITDQYGIDFEQGPASPFC